MNIKGSLLSLFKDISFFEALMDYLRPYLRSYLRYLRSFVEASMEHLRSSIAFLVCSLLLCAQPAFALLAPLEQEIVEIKAILSDDKLRDAIGSGEIIQSIRKTDDGYVIHTAKQELHVEVSYLPAKRPGPAQFELHFKTN